MRSSHKIILILNARNELDPHSLWPMAMQNKEVNDVLLNPLNWSQI